MENNNQPNTKACPYCGEEILSVAVKCKHCGTVLDDNNASTNKAKGSNAGAIGGLIGACGSLYFWFLSNTSTLNFITISPFDYILNRLDSPDIGVYLLWGTVGITTLVASLILASLFKLIFK